MEAIKILADARRMEILRMLMAGPATLTQLGSRLKRSAAWVRHHVNALLAVGLVELGEVRVRGRATEKYYRAVSDALILEQLILPKSRQPVVLFSGSDDPAIQTLAEILQGKPTFLTMYVGSLNGLTNLRQGLCHVSGIHLQDAGGEYNRPFVRHFFADRDVEMVTLAHRMQGLMVSAGNPKAIRRIEDLRRPGVRFVNRNAGSGTRLWIDAALQKRGIDHASLMGYEHSVTTHTQAAWWIKSGRADAALGLQAAAHESGLDFVPLFEERYDLVLPRQVEKAMAPILDYIQTAQFRAKTNSMTGYNTSHSGELIPL
ncbi:MAG TPA: substrate-binding domain-containing protein [Anaerolineales bacterium]|nr:substrate-binding domain-containing protein [Anaerolineales bacterium]